MLITICDVTINWQDRILTYRHGISEACGGNYKSVVFPAQWQTLTLNTLDNVLQWLANEYNNSAVYQPASLSYNGQVYTPTSGGGAVTGIKRLVTNLTDNETLIKAVIYANDAINTPKFIRKYPVADGTAFEFEFKNVNYVEFGAGAGLARFLAQHWLAVATLVITTVGFALIWRWEDIEMAKVEAQADLADATYKTITDTLTNPTLTDAQKTTIIEKLLAAYGKGTEDKTDWGSIALTLGLAAIGIYALTNIAKGWK